MRAVWMVLMSGVLAGCSAKEEKSESRIKAVVEENLAARRASLWKECRESAVDRASEVADSLLLIRARQAVIDSAKAPPRPLRPDLLPPEISADTTPVRPLWEPGKEKI